jgi:hypothetical protein
LFAIEQEFRLPPLLGQRRLGLGVDRAERLAPVHGDVGQHLAVDVDGDALFAATCSRNGWRTSWRYSVTCRTSAQRRGCSTI